MKSSILFVHFQKPHPAHEGFAKAINADFLYYDRFNIKIRPKTFRFFINGIFMPKYDVYLCEGGDPLIPVVSKKLFSSRGKVIELIADETYIMMTLGIPIKSRHHNFIFKIISSRIDGAIAVSEFVKEEARKILECPIKVAYPYIEENMYEKLGHIYPDLEGHNIISVAYSHSKNGMDILVDAFKIVKKETPDAELWIIGKGYPEKWNEIEGIHVTGFVDDLLPFLKKASLFVLVGRGQTFPVSTLESLRAGLPTIVSKYTGTKEVVGHLGREFVREINADDVAKGIIKYFDLSIEKKRKLSKQAKELSREFNKSDKCEEFKKQFKLILEEIK